MNKMRRKKVAYYLFIFLFIIIFAGCSSGEETEVKERKIPVRVEKVDQGTLSGSNLINGTVVATDSVDVMPKSMGEIVKINVKKGDKVKKGDILAELDNKDEKNAVEQQRAALKQAEAGLKAAENGKETAQGNLKQSEASLRQAKSALSEAKSSQTKQENELSQEIERAENALKETEQNYSRIEEMYQEGLVSREDFQEVKGRYEETKQSVDRMKQQGSSLDPSSGLNTLEASVEQAKAGVDLAKSSIKDADIAIEQASSGVEQARLGVEAAEARLEDTLIKAPISGEVIELNFQEGELASQQGPFATITSLDDMKVVVNVVPELLESFEVDDKVEVKVGTDTKTYEATISYIASVSTTSGLFTVEAEFEQVDKHIKPGTVAIINLEEELVTDTILVPTDSIVQQEGLDVVFIVEEGIAVRKEVDVLRYGSDYSAVKGPLSKGDVIVSSGQNLLDDGDEVNIVEEE